MTDTPTFNDLTPPWELTGEWDNMERSYTAAARWGARHGWEQARQLWPEPIQDRKPNREDADDLLELYVEDGTGRLGLCHWHSWNGEPWLHTPRWQPRQPSLQEQALKQIDAYEAVLASRGLNCVMDLPLIRRALEQAGEGQA